MPAPRKKTSVPAGATGGGSRNRIRIIWTDDGLSEGFRKFPEALDRTIKSFMEYQSSSVQDAARTNASWTDRTGNARQGLFAKEYADGATWGIVLYHTVPYGIWLEVANSGKFAVINPTVLAEGQRIMNSLGTLLTKMEI